MGSLLSTVHTADYYAVDRDIRWAHGSPSYHPSLSPCSAAKSRVPYKGPTDPTPTHPPPEGIAYIDDMPAGVLVIIPDEEVDEDSLVELRVQHSQLPLQLPREA